MVPTKRKILFFAEGATLAHVGRPFVLAETLDPAEFEVVFARPPAFGWLTREAGFRVVDLYCQDGAVFARRLDWGQPLYDFDTLARYVQDDLTLIEAERPDVIVGDFRLSLSVSARLTQVPYITICDAYWSPERPLAPLLPVMAWTPYLPLGLAERAFKLVAPFAMTHHTLPLERLRARHGLPSLGRDIRRCYTDADLRLFANPPALFPEIKPSPQADFIGPIAWSPRVSLDFDLPSPDQPLIYVTMGSSGDLRVLRTLLPVLGESGYSVVVASGGRAISNLAAAPNIRIFDFLPGDLVCQHAALVICNGGSPTTNQALSRGVPVLGIARNMDQFLNMDAIARHGAGLCLRSDRLSSPLLESAIHGLMDNPRYRQQARSLSNGAQDTQSMSQFSTCIKRQVAPHGQAKLVDA